MSYRFVRVASGALVIVCAATLASLPVATRAASVLGAMRQAVEPQQNVLHNGPLAIARPLLAVAGPAGCKSGGPFSFIGEPGAGFPHNFAGRNTSPTFLGYAGVVAGYGNEACDQGSVIGGGFHNVLGGDGTARAASIAGGFANTVEGAPEAFIGGGNSNKVGPAALFGSARDSAIASGFSNTVGSPTSFIGAGTGNSIAATLAVSPNDRSFGQGAFIGAGFENNVGGNFAGIVSGQQNSVVSDYGALLGGWGNSVTGRLAALVGGVSNSVQADYSFIGGGVDNVVLAQEGTLGGGQSNVLSGQWATLAGGIANKTASQFSFIGGGAFNTVATNSQSNGGYYSVIAGGNLNSIAPTAAGGGEYSSIGGGYHNSISAFKATVAGGNYNSASGGYAAIGGGSANTAGGAFATVPGGQMNIAAGADSFAAGTGAHAAQNGTFVWSDGSSRKTPLTSTAANQFLARAVGGFFLYSSANLSTGVTLAPGSGSWSSVSDRAAKTAFEDIDDARILAKVAAMPVSEWSYTAQGTGVRHLGPMAQDFRAAFGLGEDERHISTVDEEGVALAAIKALRTELVAKDRALATLRRSDDTKFASLERRLEALAAGIQATKFHSRRARADS